METSWEVIVSYLLILDALGANIVSWSDGKQPKKWYKKHFRLMSRYFPITKGWTTYYLVLALFIYYLASR